MSTPESGRAVTPVVKTKMAWTVSETASVNVFNGADALLASRWKQKAPAWKRKFRRERSRLTSAGPET